MGQFTILKNGEKPRSGNIQAGRPLTARPDIGSFASAACIWHMPRRRRQTLPAFLSHPGLVPTDSKMFLSREKFLVSRKSGGNDFCFGSRLGHKSGKKLCHFGIFAAHAYMGLPGWWFDVV